ncbi:hypothetical protein GYMLUDRAFT_250214 [Collybiopsis luxurians FD-317 M1]|uniref:Uncharacterized protein n=1 Tax=Collybiopsis luxurians FD-317 M1 TaxID=944289 RepID=A0A0D0CFA6_9AGAR|nr:hypothetical protein GYMLUDRAFT_250214 [Collybiopsis luxurians FD-317 M1]
MCTAEFKKPGSTTATSGDSSDETVLGTLIFSLNDLPHLVSLVSAHLDVETSSISNSGVLDLDTARGDGGSTINFDKEARFAGPHELGMLLRWALARVARINTHPHPIPLLPQLGETGTPPLLPHHPFLHPPPAEVDVRRVRECDNDNRDERVEEGEKGDLFGILARLIAHSTKSGISPPSLSPLFGPLLFSLGPLERSPSNLHLLLRISALSTPPNISSSLSSTGKTPPAAAASPPTSKNRSGTTLACFRGIPTSSPSPTRSLHSPGWAKMSGVVEVKRMVEHYERNLVRFCAGWALPHFLGAEKDKDKDKNTTSTSDGKMPPRYFDAYHRKMNILPAMEPGSSPFAPASLSSSTSSMLSYSSLYSFTLSLLTRSTSIMEKPLPLFTWSMTPVLASEMIIESAFLDVWVDLVSWRFASGTVDVDVFESRMGVYGAKLDPNTNVSGMALSRTISRDDGDIQDPAEAARWKSELFKEFNWVLAEFKALPNSSPALSSHVLSNDPHTSTLLLLFEEYAPREYCAQLGHQLAGIHSWLTLNPSLGSAYSSSTPTSPPSSSTGVRVRLSSLFSSPGHAGAVSTVSFINTGQRKKEKKVKEVKSKKDKKDKAGVG